MKRKILFVLSLSAAVIATQLDSQVDAGHHRARNRANTGCGGYSGHHGHHGRYQPNVYQSNASYSNYANVSSGCGCNAGQSSYSGMGQSGQTMVYGNTSGMPSQSPMMRSNMSPTNNRNAYYNTAPAPAVSNTLDAAPNVAAPNVAAPPQPGVIPAPGVSR